MSNQVYSNSTDKYRSFRGINSYSLAPAQIINASDIDAIIFNNPNITPDENDVFSIGGGAITVNKDCYFSMSCVVEASVSGIDPLINPLNIVVSILLNRPGSFVDQELSVSKTSNISNSFTVYKIPLSFSGWLQSGDNIRIVGSSTTNISILQDSQLVISGF